MNNTDRLEKEHRIEAIEGLAHMLMAGDIPIQLLYLPDGEPVLIVNGNCDTIRRFTE